MSPLIFALSFLLLYAVVVVFYRLYLSPLAKFPGPKIAAATSLYNAYYDVVRGGQYIWVIEDMHRRYGPVVRTRPDVLHVNDPSFVEKLYSSSPKQRRDRYWTVSQLLQASGSILATEGHDLHQQRRKVLNPYFSQANVRKLEPMINSTLGDLLVRLQGWARESTPVRMNLVFRAATKDIIEAYAFGEGGEKYLNMPDCNAAFFDVLAPQRLTHLGTHCYWFVWLMVRMPPMITRVLQPTLAVFSRYVEGLRHRIEGARAAKELPEGKSIFHEILRAALPESEKQTQRLTEEALGILGAGSETTASTLVSITYELLANPDLLGRLRIELKTAMPDPNELPSAKKLDKCDLLNAIIKEGLRLHPGATHRQDRVAPNEDLIFTTEAGQELVIPAGVAVGMTAPLLNRHPALYDRPNEFRPDRYIENPTLSKHLFSFSKGTRHCLGVNLAYQELQTFIAGIFRRYDVYNPIVKSDSPTLELYKTTDRDIAMHADYIAPAPFESSQGLRVFVREGVVG